MCVWSEGIIDKSLGGMGVANKAVTWMYGLTALLLGYLYNAVTIEVGGYVAQIKCEG